MTNKDVGVRSVAVGLLVALIATGSADAAPLKVAKPAGAPASIAAGGSFSVSVTVKNTTARKAKAGRVTLLLSKDARADAKDAKAGA